MIEIRQAMVSDKPAIFEFLPKAYKEIAQYKFPERWEWQFEKNPFRKGDKLPVWIAVNENGAVVGQICAMFEPLKIGTETDIFGSWAVDLIVLPEYRDQKLGYKLSQAIYNHSDVVMALPMSDAFRHFMTKLGSNSIDTVPVYSRIARFDTHSTFDAIRNRLHAKWPAKMLLWIVHVFWIDRLITALINFVVGIKDLGLSKRTNTAIEIMPIDEFDHTVDQLWESISPHFQAIVQRTSQFLNWKYVQQPYMDYQRYRAVRNGKMCGYIIFRKTSSPENNSGIIADLFVPAEDKATIYSLLAFAVQHLKSQQVKYIEAASTVDAYKQALFVLGFRKKKDMHPLFHNKIETPAIQDGFVPNAWFLGRSDHDWDQFPYA